MIELRHLPRVRSVSGLPCDVHPFTVYEVMHRGRLRLRVIFLPHLTDPFRSWVTESGWHYKDETVRRFAME